jgi:hypothetical protein
LDAEVRRSPFDHIAQPDLLIADKPRKAHVVRWAFGLGWMVIASYLLGHNVCLRAFAIAKLLVIAKWRPAKTITAAVDLTIKRTARVVA